MGGEVTAFGVVIVCPKQIPGTVLILVSDVT